MRIRYLLIIVLAGGMLAACGGDKHTGQGSNQARASGTAPTTGNASTAQVAAEARGDLHCPAEVKTANPPGTPVDDVVGVRPAMSYDDAANVVMCSSPSLVVKPETDRGFQIQTYGQTIRQGFSARFAEPRVQKTGRDYAREMQQAAMERGLNTARHDMKPGQSKWFVSTMGMPGQENVIGAAREQWFDTDRNPTVDSITQSLIAKYGKPTRNTDASGYEAGYRSLSWAYDPRGRLITETSPLYNTCRGISDPDGGMNLSADCGIVVQAELVRLRSNPALVKFLQVGVVDQAEGYKALADTKQGLLAMDAAHRAKQVRDASKNAQAPQL